MVIIYALLPIIKNTYTGISSIDPKLREAAEGIGLSSWQKLIKSRNATCHAFYYGRNTN